MKNSKGFSLVELLVSVAIVAALSIYFYKIINILSIKYNEVEKEKNNVVNETYITRFIYDSLENNYTITLTNGDHQTCANCIIINDGSTDKIIKITGMDIAISNTSATLTTASSFPYTIPIIFNDEDYSMIIYN